jgi:hypothetical protein
MQISFELELRDDERSRIASILDCSIEELEQGLADYGAAALREYINMFLGSWTASRISDFHEYRLLALIQEVFEGDIPDEDVVVRHFSMTPSQARGLIRSVLSKHQYELSEPLRAALSAAVSNCDQQGENDTYEVVINNTTVVEELNRLLGSIDGRLPGIRKKRGSVSVYQVNVSSYEELCNHLGLPIRRYGDE